MPLVCSFPPIAAADARVLVLGTVPSIASLAKQQYYGHPQNAFWPIMGRLFGAGRELPYDERKRVLREHGVAVWDVFRECYREGSLDTAIDVESESPNDIAPLLSEHPPNSHDLFQRQQSRVGVSPARAAGGGRAGPDVSYRAIAVDEPGTRGADVCAEADGVASGEARFADTRGMNHEGTKSTKKIDRIYMINRIHATIPMLSIRLID